MREVIEDNVAGDAHTDGTDLRERIAQLKAQRRGASQTSASLQRALRDMLLEHGGGGEMGEVDEAVVMMRDADGGWTTVRLEQSTVTADADADAATAQVRGCRSAV